jgi:site-specific DNA recombinase
LVLPPTDYAKQSNRQKLDSTKALQVEIGKHNDRISKAQQMMVDGEITTAEYREIRQRYEQEIIRLQGKQAEIKQADEGLAEYVSNTAKLLRNLPEYYAGAALPVKQKLIGSILAEKLVFEKNKFRTIKLNEVINLICRTGGGLAGNEKGLLQQSEEQSLLVPGMGVEPTLALLRTGF